MGRQRILINFFLRLIASIITTASILLISNSYAEQVSNIAQTPLNITSSIAPNIILTLDDSGSMSWSHIPDNIEKTAGAARYNSSDFNPIQYNPNINYVVPPAYNEQGELLSLDTRFERAPVNGFDPSRNIVNLSRDYRPIREHRIPDGRIFYASPRSFPQAAFYYRYNPNNRGNCRGNINNDSCYDKVIVGANSGPNGKDEKKNFAIWYSFYRSRALATLSAASIAFDDMSPSIRLTWQGIAECTTFNGSDNKSCRNNSLKSFSKQHKGQFYSWLRSVNFNYSTPIPAAMIRAGNYLTTATPWQAYPNGLGGENTPKNTFACRPTYHVLMTDGMWNEWASHYPSGFSDEASFTLPDGTKYTGQRPFYDSTSRTLADLAMHYWATDARPKLENKMIPRIVAKNQDPSAEYWDPRNNPATWQHMVNFMVGLGLTNALNADGLPWEGDTYSGAYNKFKTGTSWPAAGIDIVNKVREGRDANVYDLWHAAINSRGEFFSADTPEGMIQAFRRILDSISNDLTSGAPPAISSSVIEDGTGDNRFERYYYHTEYDASSGWSGDVVRSKKQYERQKDGSFKEQVTQEWSAQEKLNALNPALRNIKTVRDGQLVDFVWGQAGDPSSEGTLAYYLNQSPDPEWGEDGLGAARLSFLRGENSSDKKIARVRDSVLGDIYSSQAVIVAGARSLASQANLAEPNTGYQQFIERQRKRDPRIYVGANDGMLHAFKVSDGSETFAYVPRAVFSKLNLLTATNYNQRHQFYVDGTPVIADIYDAGKKRWLTILIGTLRAGGKGIFALDITDPDDIQLLWDKTAEDFADQDVQLGYTFAKPTVARMHHGSWAVVIGNGYESADDSAGLLIINALTGEVEKTLAVEGDGQQPNGLSTPQLVDNNSDGVADYAYAGDLQGNLWRFDLLGAKAGPSRENASIYGDRTKDLSRYQVSFAGKPLFVAQSGQPITAAPTLVRHPTRTGYMVMFGTGKYFELTDNEIATTPVQTVYGIWDSKTKAELTTANDGGFNIDSLLAQKISKQSQGVTSGGAVREARQVSDTRIDWNKSNKRGWYLNLEVNGRESQGERVVEKLTLLGQKTVFVSSLVANPDPCLVGGQSWLYALDPFSGGATRHQVFDAKHRVPGDFIVSATNQDGYGGITLGRQSDNAFEACTGLECLTVYPDMDSVGRQSWRIVPEYF